MIIELIILNALACQLFHESYKCNQHVKVRNVKYLSKNCRLYIQLARLTSICLHVFGLFHLHLHEPGFLLSAITGQGCSVILYRKIDTFFLCLEAKEYYIAVEDP